MVAKALGRGLIAATLIWTAAPAAAADLCTSLFVPEGYRSTCETSRSVDGVRQRVVVKPLGQALGSLNRLSVTRLDPVRDIKAWHDPAAWLEDQLAFDVGGVARLLRGIAADPDNPVAGPAFVDGMEELIGVMEGWSRAALAGCGEPTTPGPGRHDLDCRWAAGPAGLDARLRLIEVGDARYAVAIHAVDQQRLRHLEAIANSLKLD